MFCRETGAHHVEDVEVTFALALGDDAGFLEEVVGDVAGEGDAGIVEMDLHVLAEAAGVVVAARLERRKRERERKREGERENKTRKQKHIRRKNIKTNKNTKKQTQRKHTCNNSNDGSNDCTPCFVIRIPQNEPKKPVTNLTFICFFIVVTSVDVILDK